MPLRQDQTKEVLRLYRDGKSTDEIASGMHVAVSDVEPFIPTGELLIAYQRVREAKLRFESVDSEYKTSLENDDAYLNNETECEDAIAELSEAIKLSMAETKSLKATRKKVTDRLNAVQAMLNVSETESLLLQVSDRDDELAEFDEELESAKKVDVLKRQKAADAVSRRQRSERMAENALIAAAVEAASGVVAKSINARLEREEKENAA